MPTLDKIALENHQYNPVFNITRFMASLFFLAWDEDLKAIALSISCFTFTYLMVARYR